MNDYPTYVESLITVEELRDKDARIAELEAALRPFADAFNKQQELWPDDWYMIHGQVGFKHYEQAAAVLEGAE